MQTIFKSLAAPLLLVLIHMTCCAQDINDVLEVTDRKRSSKLTSLKTESLAELLQASITDGIISSSDAEINVKTTIFQLKKLWKPDIVIDTNYRKETFARNFEFGSSIKLNDDNRVIGFGTSIRYAIINHRDVSVITRGRLQNARQELDSNIGKIVTELNEEVSTKINTAIRMKKLTKLQIDDVTKTLTDFTSSKRDAAAVASLKKELGKYTDILGIDKSALDYTGLVHKEMNEMADAFEALIKKGSLLTWGFSSNYKDKQWDSLSSKLEYIKGLGWVEDKPWDVYAAVFYDLRYDTFRKKALNRHIFSAKLGLNKVILKNRDGSSFLELLGAAEYGNVLQGLYPSEDNQYFMADFTLTLRLSKSLFLPFEIKYDPENANLFGFLKLKWDMFRTNAKE